MARELTEEEIIALEVSEDKRLREMGINPNGDQAEILLLMAEKMAAIEAKDALRAQLSTKT